MDIGNSNDGVNVNAGLYAMFDVFVFGLCHCEVPTEVTDDQSTDQLPLGKADSGIPICGIVVLVYVDLLSKSVLTVSTIMAVFHCAFSVAALKGDAVLHDPSQKTRSSIILR